MYSEEIQELLEAKDIQIGDRVEVNGKKGLLLPKSEAGSPGSIVLKIDGGYNIGIDPEEIKLVEKRDVDDTGKVEIEHLENKSDILIIHTGGTIASRVSYEEGGVKAEAFSPEDMAEMYPETEKEVNLHSEVYVGEIMSEDMEPEHWQGIARKINEFKKEYDGIIVGHGTDTLGDTAAALNLMLKGIDTGVLLVGAQRSSDRPSSDAQMNVHCAAKFLSETDFTGVGVCMHETSSDDICSILPGGKTRKMHTSRRDAFEPINADKTGEVNYQTGEIKYEKRVEEKEYNPRYQLEKQVGFLKIRPGLKPEKIDFLIEQNYKGVIVEGTGLGHTPISSFDEHTEQHSKIRDKIEKLAEDSIVVIASNCIHGRTDLDVYDNQRKLKNAGAIGSRDMHPELAYVKLMWALGQTDKRDKAEEIFQENVNGEIKERSIYNE